MRSDRLIATVGTLDHDDFSLARTADLDVPEAARRLEADLVADPEADDILTMAATAVPGGVVVGWDLHPGGGSEDEDSLEHRYEFHAVAYCFAYVDLAPTDARSLTGPCDAWLRLPDRDYWSL